DLPYHKKLGELAERFHQDKVDAACEDFCGELIKLLPKNGDAYYYRGTVRQALGKGDGAKEDFTRALQLGTNFPQEARAALEGGATAAPKSGASPPAARQVVVKGVFADKGTKKLAGVP